MNESFDSNGYIKVEELIDLNTIKTVSQYFENKINRGEWSSNDCQNNKDSSKFGYYADPLIEVLLLSAKEKIENKTGLELDPTYSYSRVYQGGEQLLPHTDRESCEISVTINVACTGEPWPIWMQYEDNDPVKCILNPGDAVIYKGCEVTHWRRRLPMGELNVQFMLHYVNKAGANKQYKYDQRAKIGASNKFKGS